MIRKIILLLLCTFTISTMVAQEADRAGFLLHNKLYRAHKELQNKHYKRAVTLYEKLYDKGVLNDVEKGDYAEALINFHQTEKAEEVLDLIPKRTLHEDELLIRAAMYNGNYDKAEEIMRSHPELEILDMKILGEMSIDDYVESIRYEDHYTVEEVTFNTEVADFAPIPLGDSIFFVSERGTKNLLKGGFKWKGEPYLKVYVATSDGIVEKADKHFNTGYHDGPICFNSDGSTAFVTENNYQFTNYGNKKADINSLIIYVGKKDEKGRWGEFYQTPFGSEQYNCTHPFLSDDDRRLYFVSDMPGGYGGTDIYYVDYDGEHFGEPVNMGADINTEYNEYYPIWGQDGRFYFSSRGYPGFGGIDVFMAQKVGGEYVVKNVGYPINSDKDDFSFFLQDKQNGYLASNREGGTGDDDIYKFKIEKAVPFSADIKAKVIDANTKSPLSGANVTICNVQEGVSQVTTDDGMVEFSLNELGDSICFSVKDYSYYSDYEAVKPISLDEFVLPLRALESGIYGYVYDENSMERLANSHIHVVYDNIEEKDLLSLDGNYRQALSSGKVYDIVVTRSGYFPYEFSVNTSDFEGWKEYNIPLRMMMELENILYDFDKADITARASVELDKLVLYLKDHPSHKVRLESHTDIRGTLMYNDGLSERRAYSAKKYLVKAGIAPQRIIVESFGERQLKNKCTDGVSCTEEQHHENRRTEVFIIVK